MNCNLEIKTRFNILIDMLSKTEIYTYRSISLIRLWFILLTGQYGIVMFCLCWEPKLILYPPENFIELFNLHKCQRKTIVKSSTFDHTCHKTLSNSKIAFFANWQQVRNYIFTQIKSTEGPLEFRCMLLAYKAQEELKICWFCTLFW